MEIQTDKPELLTVNEAAEIMRIGRTSANGLLWSGELRSIKVGRRRLIRRVDLDEFLRANEVSASRSRSG